MSTSRHPLDRKGAGTETFSLTFTSNYSTNYTQTGLIGTGRALGILYSYAGRRLERVVGRVAHKAGLGPHAMYSKIQELIGTEWRNNDRKSEPPSKLCTRIRIIIDSLLESVLRKLCFTLFDYTKYVF